MGHGYVAVGWSRQKRIYDAVLTAGVLVYLGLFAGLHVAIHPNATIETAIIRALGTCAFLMLHVVLSIGPLARLDRRFLPLLYNRRHLGVTMFCVAAAHGAFSIFQFHALSNMNPFVSVLVSDGSFRALPGSVPFQPLGAAALGILLVMAATSHDFWLANLTAPVWKSIHMLVYLAYALLVAHIAFGALHSDERAPLFGIVAAGATWILGVHLAAALRGRAADREAGRRTPDGWVDVCAVDAVTPSRPVGVTIGGERVAVVRNGDAISAISAVCRHQNGPLDEGRVIDGCLTCPWHGYQYLPETGASPPPFTETLPTFDVRVQGGRIHVHPRPHVPGTRVEPARVSAAVAEDPAPFYVGWLPQAPPPLARFVRRAVLVGFAAAVAAPVAVVSWESAFPPSRFEFGVARAFEGILREHPFPALEVAGDHGIVSYALVAPGKFGAAPLVTGLDGAPVRLKGSLIERQGRSMVEVEPETITRGAGASAGAEAPEDRGAVTLRGEIVDAKCFLGVMNPGATTVHRACARRCISGGIPALFWARDRTGTEAYLMLTGLDGRPLNADILDLVAEPVEATGRVERIGDRWYLRADPRQIRRLP